MCVCGGGGVWVGGWAGSCMFICVCAVLVVQG